MRGSGRASPIEPAADPGRQSAAGRRGAIALACWVLAFWCPTALALDFFTLWQRPELPLNLEAGLWADYRRQALAGGKRTDDLLRIQCLGVDRRGNWVLEIVPLVETSPAVFAVVAGEGLRLHLSAAVTGRRDGIMEVVEEVRLWRDGAMRFLDRQEWRQDPLVTASFSGDFQPSLIEEQAPTVRIITDRTLTCRQLTFSAADTQQAILPQGRVIQATTQEVAAAVHPDIPLLGLAFVTERIRAESWLEPPGERRLPPPQVRIEILECLDFGRGARALLTPAADLSH